MHSIKIQAFFIGVMCLLFFATTPYASALKKDQGLIVRPLRQRVAQDPGSTSASKVTVTNDSDARLVVTLSSENFGVINENYDYNFKNDESAKWVRFVNTTIELQPREKKEIGYSLAIPATATSGAYDIALLATIEGDNSDSSITEYRRVASLIYLDVKGEVEKKGSLLAFDIPWLTTTNDIPYQLRVANQGNSHLEFDIPVDSRLVGGSNHNQTSAKTLTLPRTVRSINDVTQIGSVPGVYTVTANYSPPQGQTQTIKKRIIYVPWTFTLSLLFLASLIMFGALERRYFGRLKKKSG